MIVKNIAVPSWLFMLTASLILAVAFGLLYWFEDGQVNPKLAALYAGFSSAFLVAFFQLFSSILDALKLREYERLGVKEILKGRRGMKYYGDLIGSSQKHILVMGLTASRFMSDFGKKGRDNNQLTKALASGVTARFLLPKLGYMNEEDRAKLKNTTIPISDSLKKTYEDRIEIRYFDHIAAHSIVVVDDMCIAGPVFTDTESKNTPAVVLKSDSEYAKPYIAHFEREWKSASENA